MHGRDETLEADVNSELMDARPGEHRDASNTRSSEEHPALDANSPAERWCDTCRSLYRAEGHRDGKVVVHRVRVEDVHGRVVEDGSDAY